jgi:carbamoyltransferase
VDGRLVAAVNEERLTRRKLEVVFPARSIDACLELGSLRPSAIDAVASCTSDVAKALGRLFPSTKEAYYEVRRRKAAPGWSADICSALKYRVTEWKPNAASRFANRWALRRLLHTRGFTGARLFVYDHHECHAATAAYASGFDTSALSSRLTALAMVRRRPSVDFATDG